MTSPSHAEGVRLHGFAGLGARSLRARPLRSGLTMAGIVLGVGMAFGVLVLVATIRSSFDDLFDAIYGNTSVVVTGKASIGEVPQGTIVRVREAEGVDAAVGQVMGIFRVIGDEGKAKARRRPARPPPSSSPARTCGAPIPAAPRSSRGTRRVGLIRSNWRRPGRRPAASNRASD